MPISAQTRLAWEQAQIAEQGHWAELWLPEDLQPRKAIIENETIKGEFIFQQMVDHFEVQPKTDWSTKSVLDVGCGPLSLIAHHQFGQPRAGVDPLIYPSWVYDQYDKHDFNVYKQPFEEVDPGKKFDVLVFYNALQHFADLEMMAQKCRQLLSSSGVVYLSEYLEVPTNEAHIQYLEAQPLDKIFGAAGFKVNSVTQPVLLAGYVERPGGAPIDLYLAELRQP